MTSVSIFGADININITPNPIFAGEQGKYEIISTIGKPEMISFPNVAGMQWMKNSASSGIQIVNFDRKDTLSYPFVVAKPGVFTIPPTQIRVGNRIVKTNAVQLTVKKREFSDKGKKITLNEMIFLKVFYGEGTRQPEQLYLGQELNLKIKLYVDQRLQIYTDKFNQNNSFTNANNYFPNVKIENAIFRNYSKQNKHNNKFRYEQETSEIKNGLRFRVFTYYASISGVELGILKGVVEHTVPIIDPNQQGRRNARDPFGDFFSFSRRNKIFTHTARSVIDDIQIKSIPGNASEEGFYLGLIGSWQVDLKMDKEEISVGEDVTLKLSIKGQGNIETLTQPELELPGFRIYPPEITRNSSRVSQGEIKWVIIPLNTESELPKLQFNTFDSKTEQFIMYSFQPKLKIKSSVLPTESGPIIEDYGSENDNQKSNTRELHRSTNVLYIKKDLSRVVKMPLLANVAPILWFIIFGGPAIYLIILCGAIRREKLQGSSSYRRRCQALKNKGALINKIKKASESELPVVVREELLPYLTAVLNVPLGATIAEILQHSDDPELAEMLTSVEMGEYMPGNSTAIDAKKLLNKLKNLAVVSLCFLITTVGHCSNQNDDAALAYDRGDIQEAELIYLDQLKKGYGNAALLYNLGNCAFRKGDYGKALVYYEKARRLAPRDSDIIENLNFVRDQLNLSPIYKNENPFDVIHSFLDKLRPDEWLLAAGLIWFAFWFTLGILRWKQMPPRIIPVILLIGFLAALYSYFAQIRGTYRSNQGIITFANTPLYRTPGQSAHETAKQVLKAGDYISIVEQRSEWSRIRIDKAEGWVKNSVFQKI